MSENEKIMHKMFELYEVKDACTWAGTKWEGEGKDARVLPCGNVAVGAGLFCDPNHSACEIHSVCERHKKPIETWANAR